MKRHRRNIQWEAGFCSTPGFSTESYNGLFASPRPMDIASQYSSGFRQLGWFRMVLHGFAVLEINWLTEMMLDMLDTCRKNMKNEWVIMDKT